MKNRLGVGSYELEHWLSALDSHPIERVAHADFSASYEMTAAHIFKLENGRYALITEEGCSCYSPSDAGIELFPTKTAAMDAFNKWVKVSKRDYL